VQTGRHCCVCVECVECLVVDCPQVAGHVVGAGLVVGVDDGVLEGKEQRGESMYLRNIRDLLKRSACPNSRYFPGLWSGSGGSWGVGAVTYDLIGWGC
jgi:hypothetical protein